VSLALESVTIIEIYYTNFKAFQSGWILKSLDVHRCAVEKYCPRRAFSVESLPAIFFLALVPYGEHPSAWSFGQKLPFRVHEFGTHSVVYRIENDSHTLGYHRLDVGLITYLNFCVIAAVPNDVRFSTKQHATVADGASWNLAHQTIGFLSHPVLDPPSRGFRLPPVSLTRVETAENLFKRVLIPHATRPMAHHKTSGLGWKTFLLGYGLLSDVVLQIKFFVENSLDVRQGHLGQ